MNDTMNLIEPRHWYTHHARALRTTARLLAVDVPEVVRRVTTLAWVKPGDSHRELLTHYRSRYGK